MFNDIFETLSSFNEKLPNSYLVLRREALMNSSFEFMFYVVLRGEICMRSSFKEGLVQTRAHVNFQRKRITVKVKTQNTKLRGPSRRPGMLRRKRF